MDEPVCSKLKNLRLSLGMKMKDVADGAGITESYLSRLESGTRLPGFEALKGLCVVYGVSSDYFLGLGWEITSLADKIAIGAKKCINTYDLKDLSSYYDAEDEECVKNLDALITDYMHIRGIDDGQD